MFVVKGYQAIQKKVRRCIKIRKNYRRMIKLKNLVIKLLNLGATGYGLFVSVEPFLGKLNSDGNES